MNRILEFTPEDMTVTVETGVTLAALQQELAVRRQWLPIDPPHAETTSIHELLAHNLSGPRRFGYGTIREHLLGMKVVLADGRTIKSGGKVVKNVAGYDLAKLFIGARDSLGIIVEATFKLRPISESEVILGLEIAMTDMAGRLAGVLESSLTPTVLDAYRSAAGDATRATMVLGLDGTRTEVDSQVAVARSLGWVASASLEYDGEFRAGPLPNRTSVLASRVPSTLRELGPRPFVARAGNGIIYYRGDALMAESPTAPPKELMSRVKLAYDPRRILPEFNP